MATGWEMLPETAKALSAPLTKLVEVVGAGCGKLYGPTDIRRTAVAQGQALIIMEEAKARGSEIALRAAHRLLDIEERRQENIEAISYVAQQQLPDEVSDVPVDPDWATRFFREAQDVSNEQMRQMWGKVLAREVTKPGSFSQRTLAVAGNLTRDDASNFEKLCSLVAKVHGAGLYTFLGRTSDSCATEQGLTFDAFIELQAAGLLTVHEVGEVKTQGFEEPPAGQTTMVLIERPGSVLFIATPLNPQAPADLALGKITLTPAGRELFEIADWRAVPEHDEFIFKKVAAAGWNVERKRVLRREGTVFHHEPWSDSDR